MTTFVAQKLGLTGVAPTYNTCTATDKFAAVPGAKYMLHYKNGATAQATGGSNNTITDSTTPIPAGSGAAAGFANAITIATPGMLSTTESVVEIDNSTRFMDAQGFINLNHPGTLTTVTVAIFGPL
jgi:hypothetical protein